MIKKRDIIFSIIVSEIIALIFLGISSSLKLPDVVMNLAYFFPIILPIAAAIVMAILALLAGKLPVLFQLAKFILIGVANTFVDLGILNLLMFFTGIVSGWFYPLFKALSFSCSVVHSFFWNKFWTFEKKETQGSGKEFGQFFLVAGIGFFLNVGIASLVVNIIGPQFGLSPKLWANLGAIVATICVSAWNFLGYKFVVFKK